MPKVIEPRLAQVLDFCARDPIERVFLEDVARRGLGRLIAVRGDGGLAAVCHIGANVVPSGVGCAAFADAASRGHARMIIGDERAVTDLWGALERRLRSPREDRPGQPVFALTEPPQPGGTGLRAATKDDLELLLPACAAAHEEELGVDPLARDPEGFRWRTRELVEEGRSWVWLDGDVILFKAEASAWTPRAVQLQQVWVDPSVRRRGYGSRALRDLCRLLLATTPVVTLFVRTDNAAAIALYEAIGMSRVGSYRSVLF
ncbi:MAG TPA: GNAT family N-acetyltransferase [Gaiellaceae bacterium]|nr:GNAT family N-acetyltransferase [Gaiellaceae bacterium]